MPFQVEPPLILHRVPANLVMKLIDEKNFNEEELKKAGHESPAFLNLEF